MSRRSTLAISLTGGSNVTYPSSPMNLVEWLWCAGELGRSSLRVSDEHGHDKLTNVRTIHGMGMAAHQHRGRIASTCMPL